MDSDKAHEPKREHKEPDMASEIRKLKLRHCLKLIDRFNKGELPNTEIAEILQRERDLDSKRPDSAQYEKKVKRIMAGIHREDLKNVHTMKELLCLFSGRRVGPPPESSAIE